MRVDDYLDVLRRDGKILGDVAERAGMDTPVPPCPGWRVRDVLLHLGGVHRWRLRVTYGADPATLAVSGTATDIYLLLWNRTGLEHLTVEEIRQRWPRGAARRPSPGVEKLRARHPTGRNTSTRPGYAHGRRLDGPSLLGRASAFRRGTQER